VRDFFENINGELNRLMHFLLVVVVLVTGVVLVVVVELTVVVVLLAGIVEAVRTSNKFMSCFHCH
jgi:hypothetical protein